MRRKCELQEARLQTCGFERSGSAMLYNHSARQEPLYSYNSILADFVETKSKEQTLTAKPLIFIQNRLPIVKLLTGQFYDIYHNLRNFRLIY